MKTHTPVSVFNPNSLAPEIFKNLDEAFYIDMPYHNKANLQAMDIICSARNKGLTYQQIANKLNKLQYTTRYKKKFNPIQVQRLFKKCEVVS